MQRLSCEFIDSRKDSTDSTEGAKDLISGGIHSYIVRSRENRKWHLC